MVRMKDLERETKQFLRTRRQDIIYSSEAPDKDAVILS